MKCRQIKSNIPRKLPGSDYLLHCDVFDEGWFKDVAVHKIIYYVSGKSLKVYKVLYILIGLRSFKALTITHPAGGTTTLITVILAYSNCV